MAEVTGNKVNRGAGYGMEIPCKYHFFGSAPYIILNGSAVWAKANDRCREGGRP